MTDKTPAQLADDAAEAVRALNHATKASGEEWQYPGDAYSTVGDLSTMAMRLPQALEQIHNFIGQLTATGKLRSDRDTLDADLSETQAGLHEAVTAADHLHQALNRAHSGLSSIAYKD